MKCVCKLLFLLAGCTGANAQQILTLQQAYDLAQQHYPITRQRDLIRQTANLNIENISKGYLPQFAINVQASYQSDVTQVKVPIPGVTITPPSKDQYKVVADIGQVMYDGGVMRSQQALQQFNADAETQRVEVELYALKDRINQVFLGALLLDEQLKQVALIRSDLNRGISRTQAQVDNGVAFRSNLSVLQAELLRTDQREIELQSTKQRLLDVLGLFIHQKLDTSTSLQLPFVNAAMDTTISRPEMNLFAAQQNIIGSQVDLIRSRNRPKASIFAQAGYGRPGLNLLKNEFDPFYIAGLRLSWNFGGLYTAKNEKRLLELSGRTIFLLQQTFVFNTQTALTQQSAEVQKLQALIVKDAAIIDLREQVKKAAQAQLDNSVITANDYLREVTAEDQARQTLITHKVQLLQAQINYLTISGKQ